MPISLSKENRKLLEKTTADARVLAEQACRAALENLAVHEREYRYHMTVEQRLLRNRLRSRGRALGDTLDSRSGVQEIRHLIELAAYEHWHRLLFTRFLTENHLLITDEANGFVPVTLEECEELAPELGARDGLDLACRFASLTLPGVFRRDDPVLDLPIALNDQVELRKLLAALPSECFRADDALGWTYQFWQAQRKEEVNKSGKKIGADELSPVTQLFTEDYMVEFLLHNTLGAWWAGKFGPITAATEEEARTQAALSAQDGVPAISWSFLRFVQDEATKTWLPAAGTFDGWPKSARLIRLLDPCMGSGHFLIFALPLLVRLRMEEESLSAQAAVVAALNDNIHGLELDERCTQIAAFNVAQTAWKLAGYQTLPPLHLACSGLAPNTGEAEWVALAGDNDRLRRGMIRLYGLFKDAPVLGSLINPRSLGGNLIEAEFHELAPLLTAAVASSGDQKDDTIELSVIAQGLAKAAELLAGKFTLVVTNVPYLGRGKQDNVIKDFCDQIHPDAKSDLATCFVERCFMFCTEGGYAALVTTQNWLFLGSYKRLRSDLLENKCWNFIVKLGGAAEAFVSGPGNITNVALFILNQAPPLESQAFAGIDVSTSPSPSEKANALGFSSVVKLSQAGQLSSPDSIITLEEPSILPRLGKYAIATEGLSTGDRDRFIRCFWEISAVTINWEFYQSSPSSTGTVSGFSEILFWENKLGELCKSEGARIQGDAAWNKTGILIARIGGIRAERYYGQLFDKSNVAIVPHDFNNLNALYAFCYSSSLETESRKLDQKLAMATSVLVKVPFDLTH